ncbi:MAG: hypothetical protein HQK53_18050 [Oligoflexia bacterium]|nr:hypothetical protein [Oligoflexia bacterium]
MTDVINKAAKDARGTKFIVVPPTIRTSPVWMFDHFELFKKTYMDLLMDPVIKAADPPIGDNDLRSDGVHLTDMPLVRYRQYIKEIIQPPQSWADEMLETEPDVETVVGDGDVAGIHTKLDKLIQAMSSNTSNNDTKFNKIESSIKDLKNTNLVSFARIKEDLDSEANARRHNIIVIRRFPMPNGFKPEGTARATANKIKDIFVNEVRKVPKISDDDFIVRSIYLIPVPEKTGFFQDFRLVCAEVGNAVEIRNRIIKARKEKLRGWEDVEVSNDPVKSTRVRIFLLQCIARKLREMAVNKDEEISVNRYSDTPNIIFKRDGKVVRQLGFVSAVSTHGEMVEVNDITKARRIAGKVYAGSLENYFVIVPEETINASATLSGSNLVHVASGSGTITTRKRPLPTASARGRGVGTKKRK